MNSKYVVQRISKNTGEIRYLSPDLDWITPADHEKYKTRYGEWDWGDAQAFTRDCKHADGESVYIAFPAADHN